MKLEGVELWRIAMPLLTPFRTSFGTQETRDAVMVRVVAGGDEGWGECVATADPVYSSEYADAAFAVLRDHLIPRMGGTSALRAAQVASRLAPVKGHPMAKAALEMAILDAELKASNMSLADYLGGEKVEVEVGVSVGITRDPAELVDLVHGYLAEGYSRIKLKIEPGWDYAPVKTVREHFGSVPLQVDANAAYRLSDGSQLARLDEFDLTMIEQPLGEHEIAEHAELGRRITTPICLDESILSARSAAEAIRANACSIVNIKPGRVGGYLEARRVHDVCAAHGVPVWCGGMLETGLGRTANLALGSLPGFSYPADISASRRYFAVDITAPLEQHDGLMTVPTEPGIGAHILREVLADVTRTVEWVDL